MKKKLPNLYVNKIERILDNNDMIYYSALASKEISAKSEDVSPAESSENQDDPFAAYTVEEKVSELFNSPNYVYKMKTQITLKDNTIITKDIIGQVDDKLITIDEDLISVDDIRDIKFQ